MKRPHSHIPTFHRLWQLFRHLPSRLLGIPESPHDIAKTFAIGVFIGVIPGVGPAFAFLVAVIFRLSKMVILLGTFTTNPWTVAFIYAGSYHIGAAILHREEAVDWSGLVHLEPGWTHTLARLGIPLMLGGVILGLAMALISYAAVRIFLHQYRSVRLRRLARRAEAYRK